MTAPRTYLDYLVDILTAIDDIEAFTRGLDEPDFTADRKTVYAVTRAIEIIGEVVKRIPDAVQGRHPQVPWRPMARMRDRIIHGYDTVDPAIVSSRLSSVCVQNCVQWGGQRLSAWVMVCPSFQD